jgi:hypothetical protein
MGRLGYSTFTLSYDGALPKLVPPQTRIHTSVIANLLFSTVEAVGKHWPEVDIDPRPTK